jgi:hypothetical protein
VLKALAEGNHVFMAREELAQAELGRFLGHTYNIPVYRVPQKGKAPHRHGVEKPEDYQPLHEVYDLAADPAQEHPLSDPDLERRLCELMRSHLDRVKAPAENWERLGL